MKLKFSLSCPRWLPRCCSPRRRCCGGRTPRRLSVLHTFSALDNKDDNTDGAYSETALVEGTDGNFYGVTTAGGAKGYGTVFKITPTGTLTTLHTFTGVDTDGRCLPRAQA